MGYIYIYKLAWELNAAKLLKVTPPRAYLKDFTGKLNFLSYDLTNKQFLSYDRTNKQTDTQTNRDYNFIYKDNIQVERL